MATKLRRGTAAVHPMPSRLDSDAILRVSDDHGRVLRTETIPGGTSLRGRLEVARSNYHLQEWDVGDFAPGQWAFTAEKNGRRLLIAVRPIIADLPSPVGARTATAS